MKMFLAILASIALLSSPAIAGGGQEALARINACLKAPAQKACEPALTKTSQSFYQRLVTNDLLACLPTKITYISEKTSGKNLVLRATTDKGRNGRVLRLLLSQEKDWKLDIPATLRLSMGENWETQVNMTEQIYLVMKQQMGGKLNCAAIEGLINARHPAKK